MKELDEIKINKNLRSDPKALANLIISLSNDIEECRNDLTGIKNRKFWKRAFTNNTKDLADALIKQNDSYSTFINIIQVLIGFNLHNAVVLGGLYEELNKISGEAGTTNNEYFQLAQDYIRDALFTTKNTNVKFNEYDTSISNIKSELIKNEQIEKKQSEMLHFLKQKYIEKDELDKELNNKLADFAVSLTNKETTIKNLELYSNRIDSKFSKLQTAFIIYAILNTIGIIFIITLT